MKQFRIYHPLWLSFFSKDLYRDVANNWKGIGVLYLLLLVSISWAPGLIKMHFIMADFVNNSAVTIVSQVPEIDIVDGTASTPELAPYFISDPETGELLGIVDVSGEYSDLVNTDAKFLLTKTKFIVEKSDTETKTFELDEVEAFLIDEAFLNKVLGVLKNWLAVLVFFVIVPFVLIGRIIQVLIYGGIGAMFLGDTQKNLNYAALVRLAAIAITPAILVNLVLSLLEINIPVLWLINFVVSIGYVYFAVKVNKPEEEKELDSMAS